MDIGNIFLRREMSGIVGNCREMSGNVGKCREVVGECREMSAAPVGGGDIQLVLVRSQITLHEIS